MEPFFYGAILSAPLSVSPYSNDPHHNPLPFNLFSMGAGKLGMSLSEKVSVSADPMLDDLRSRFGIQLVNDKTASLVSTGSVGELVGDHEENTCILIDVLFWWTKEDVLMVLGCALCKNESSEAMVQRLPFSAGALHTKTFKMVSLESANLLGTVVVGSRGKQIRVLSLPGYYSIKDNILGKNLSKSSAGGSPSVETYASAASPPPGSDGASSAMYFPESAE